MQVRPRLHTSEAALPRQPLSPREQATGVLVGLWMVIGLFLDGWAHDNNEPESFFTPWHGVLYSGFLAASVAALATVRRHHRPGAALVETLPRGHGLTLVGLAVFAAGAVGDLAWHETLGVEVGVEALLSPTHLLLLVAGLVVLSAPVRTAWQDTARTPRTLRELWPVIVSLSLLVALAGFFLVYLSPFVNDAAGARFDRVAGVRHDHPSSEVGELQQLLGVASILMTTVLLVVPIQLLLRRWTPPRGSLTMLVGIVVTMFVGLDEFSQPGLLLAGIAAGAAGDLAVARRQPRLAGLAVSVVMWLGYFALYEITVGSVAWSAELWSGTVFLAGLVAAAAGLATSPTAMTAGYAEPAHAWISGPSIGSR